MTTEVAAHSLFSGPDRGLLENVVLRHDNGVITDISAGAPPATSPRSLVLPAFVNAHDHARPTASSFGALGMPLESWILRSALGTPVDPYLTAASALARSARAGCAAMMIHYTRPSGTMPLVEEAGAIARAASDVGIRIAFALAVRDQNPVVYGDEEPVLSGLSKDDRSTIEQLFVRAPMSPKAYIELTDAIAAAIAGPKVDVQLGPAGVQWCSKPLLEAVAENSAQTGRRIHMHLLETIYQRAWADQHFPQGIVRYLHDIGFLSERLTLAHCIHARPDEIEMIAASGARIVTNFSSNMHLRSGLAPIAAAHKCGCAIAVGVDGLGARRGRRRAARDAAGADDARRSRFPAHLDHFRIPRRSPSPTAARRPARRERVRWYLAHQPISSPSISIGLTATRSCRSMPSIFYSRAAMRRCCAMWLWMGEPSSATAAVPASIFRPSSRNCAGSTAPTPRRYPAFNAPGRRSRRRCRAGSKRISIAVRPSRFQVVESHSCKQAASEQQLALRALHVFRKAEQNSTCIGIPSRFHVRQQETDRRRLRW